MTNIEDKDKIRRLMVEAQRLANLSPGEWRFWIDDSAKQHGVARADLEKAVLAIIKANEKKQAETKKEAQQRERRVEKEKVTTQKQTERRQRDREKAFRDIAELPIAQHEAELERLARRLDESLEQLRDDFSLFLGEAHRGDITGDGRHKGDVEPWPDPVDTKKLLTELLKQLRRYVILRDEVAIAVTLWTMMAWVHNEIAVHSPLLVLTSADVEEGKTTTIGVLEWLTPRAYPAAEITGPALYRFVDQVHPTLMIDDADTLFKRRTDLVHIVAASWTKGTPIPRRVGNSTVFFDPFCPKIIGLIGLDMRRQPISRSIICKLMSKLPEEQVEGFSYRDDATFEELRRKLTRWSIDNMAALKDADPVLPLGFNNRLAANWRLLFAIADLAGYGKQARAAAVKLSYRRPEPSEGKRLLAALQTIFSKHAMLGSDELQKLLTADKDDEWCSYRGHGPITQREIALLLDPYGVHPRVIHPTGRADHSVRGYKAEWFTDIFRRYLPAKRTTVHQPQKKRGKVRKRKR
jgi:Protein of unknown function (DUF3631)